MKRNLLYTLFLGGLLATAGCYTHHRTGPLKKVTQKTTQTYKNPQISAIPEQAPSDLFQEPYWISAKYWINSKPLNKKDLEGKLVLLDFWATWCAPCVRFLPEIEEYHRENKDKGVIVIGICPIYEELDSWTINYHKQFARDYKITFPIVLDEYGKTLKKYGITGVPATFLLDGNGKIIEKNGKIIEKK